MNELESGKDTIKCINDDIRTILARIHCDLP